jgi:hypothetical protein
VPARYAKLRAALAKLGVRVSERSGKGSHVVVDDGKGHSYPLPLHHGTKTELSDVYVRGLCRALDLDYEELRKNL